ncbi:MAG: hypothetical protein IPJ41_17830 [Phycisphaerales bacterium]|nr:hypothetical protein [Phycisphaerales bacterium]
MNLRLLGVWLVAMAVLAGGVYLVAGAGWAMIAWGAIMLVGLEQAVRPRRVRR